MINLTFNWAWIPIVLLIVFGVGFFFKQSRDDQYGVGSAVGCFVCLLCLLGAWALGGIFIW